MVNVNHAIIHIDIHPAQCAHFPDTHSGMQTQKYSSTSGREI